MSKTKNLVIVESPAKAKTISRFLGKDYSVVASMGHIRDLPKSQMGIDMNQVTTELEKEGVQAFADAYTSLLASLQKRMDDFK